MRGRAVVFVDQNRVEYAEVEVSEPRGCDVVIDVETSWISIGTESSFLRGERLAGEVRYEPGGPWPFPQVPGYQKVGTVLAVGSEVAGLVPGDHVFASVSRVSGMFFDFGGHVSPAVTSADEVWKLPVGADAADYAGLVLTQVGYNCGMRPVLAAGDHAVVIGDGLVAHWSAQTLLHRGAKVTVLGRHDERLARLPKGAEGVNTRHAGVDPAHLGHRGVCAVIDTVGDMETVRNLQPSMSHNSHIVSAGFLGDAGLVDIQSLRDQEITLHTPSGWQRDRMDATLQGIREGWLQTSSLVTHSYPVEQAAAAWDDIRRDKQSCLGVLLDWKLPK